MSEQPTPSPRYKQRQNSLGQFCGTESTLPVGTVRIRTRHKRGGRQRAWIKVAEPNTWVLRARWVWEQANGPIPRGIGVHHKDRDTLNDSLDNLELVSKAAHVNEHRPEWEARRIESVRRAATGRTWSTRSKDKLTGRPPKFDPEKMAQAIAAYQAGEGSYREVANRYGVKWDALAHQIKKLAKGQG